MSSDPDEAAADDKPAGGRLLGKLNDEEQEAVQLPNAAVAVVRGHLFVSSHVDFLEKVLAGADEHERLDNDGDFQRVNDELKKLGATQICVRNFSPAPTNSSA